MGAKDRLRAAAVMGLLLTGFPSAFAQNWKLTSAPITNWSSVASSANGSILVATVYDGPVYLSTNAGIEWIATDAPIGPWRTIACSADGIRFSGGAYMEGIYTSTNRGGLWHQTAAPKLAWQSIASSADGIRQVAAETNLIHASTNCGVSWFVTTVPSYAWSAVASSADGHTMGALGGGYRGYPWRFGISTNSVSEWWLNYILDPGIFPTSLTFSADGTKVFVIGGGRINGSVDFGETWLESLWLTGPAFPPSFADIASSSDGSKLVAVADFSYSGHPPAIYRSSDSGTNWITNSVAASAWRSVASSVDGNRLVAVVGNPAGGIYTWQTTPSPKLNVSLFNSGLLISWIVPSMPFVLQEAADLNATDWIDVTTQPTLNLTNLHHEVNVPLSSTNRFFRLKSL